MFGLFKSNGHLDCCLQIMPEIMPDGWFVLEVNKTGECMWSDGKTVFYPDTLPPSENHIWSSDGWLEDTAGLIESAKALKIKQLNAAAQAYIDRAAETDKVPDFEVRTWTIQAAEATAWAADKNALTPVLDRIAASRGIDADKLKAAALRKTLAYEKLTAHIVGQRQALQSKIETAKTQAELDKIVITFTVPEAV